MARSGGMTSRPVRACRGLSLCSCVAAALVAGTNAHAADWLQFGVDPAHSGYNREEHGFSTAGNKRLFAVSLPAQVDSAPVFLGGVATNAGTRDVLFIAARNGLLAALNAADGSLIWSAQPPGSGVATGSPAIDPGRQFVYFHALDGKIHKYQVGDGSEVLTGGWPQVATLKPDADRGASGLTIATAADNATYLYSVTSSYYDTGDYQGHLTAIDLSGGTQNVFNAQCSDLAIHFVDDGITSGASQNDCPQIPSPLEGQTANSGIWGRPGATYDALTDRVYIATGNGLFDPHNDLGNGIDWGDSVLALHPDGTGSAPASSGLPVDSYTPIDDASLYQNDADLGSTSTAILPAPAGSNVAHLGLQGGKDGCLRLLNLDDLSGMGAAGHVGGELQAIALPNVADHCADGANIGAVTTQPAVWANPLDASTWVFVAYGTGIAAYRVAIDAGGNPSLTQQWSSPVRGTSPVVADATVYYVASNLVRALDATTGALVWSDSHIGPIHWQSPILVNGRLYVIDKNAILWVYRLDGIFRNAFQ